MLHTKRGVLARTRREFATLDRLVSRLTPADWKRRVPRPPTRDPWTVKDALAHIVYWKEHSARVFRGERRLPEMRGPRREPDQPSSCTGAGGDGVRSSWWRGIAASHRDVLKIARAQSPGVVQRPAAVTGLAARLRRTLGGASDARHRGGAETGARQRAPAPVRPSTNRSSTRWKATAVGMPTRSAAAMRAPQKKMSPRISIVGSPTVMTFWSTGDANTTA